MRKLDPVVKLHDSHGGMLFVRPYDVTAVHVGVGATGKIGKRQILVGGIWLEVQETMAGIFAKLGVEQNA